MSDGLFDYLPKDAIIAAFQRSPGNEIASGKFASPESSAALAANTFGLFLNEPDRLPPIPNTSDFGWPAIRVAIEECARFPWSGGMHPWLDGLVETETHIIGIESKRYEPYRPRKSGQFSDAYWRPVWGDAMSPFETMRDQLANGTIEFERLDAFQLVKHALGLRTEGRRKEKLAALLYLYAEPNAWPDGKQISVEAKERHWQEAQRFSDQVTSAEVAFRACTYREFLSVLRNAGDPVLSNHADMIARSFEP